MDTSNERKPYLYKVIDPKDFHQANVGAPHTTHCLPNGDIMLSFMGDADQDSKGSFVVLDKSFEFKSIWKETANFNYDYWYQPRHNVMVSSEWGAPKAFRKGFDMKDVEEGKYGSSLTFWNWSEKSKEQVVDLGPEGLTPLEVRFFHDPDKPSGFVGCAVSSNIFYFYKSDEIWKAKKVISVPSVEVDNWLLPEMPGIITDILISMDDHYLYFSNWVQGDIRQYDISNPLEPRLVGQVFVGGSLCKDGKVIPTDGGKLNDRPIIKGRKLHGGPQMLQLSLDGKRLYVTDSLFSRWDAQFYPELLKKGSTMVQIDVDNEKGGLKINPNFVVDFGNLPEGMFLAHEMRYPGGDCTSDIWI